ncbi:diphthine--ammonia ligase [Archaeoglobales archaeon]|nr:MAG: diphthine--ammonia ligase [Archaeoglobales archaeon]
MKETDKVLIGWSGGKDSALTLYEIEKSYEVAALLTTVTEDYERISMHGVRVALLEKQAESLGYPLEKILISKNASNEEYEAKMLEVLEKYRGRASYVAFGDIFLEDVRKYREENLKRANMKGIFPLWGRDTAKLAQNFIDFGFKAIIICVDSKFLDESFVGRIYDENFLQELPPNVDPCGENGEFHSFVYDGPIFKSRIYFKVGEIVLRDRFYFCDLIPF